MNLASILPGAPPDRLVLLAAAMDEFCITDPLDRAAFVATVGHESQSLNVLSENLNYSHEALMRVFRKYFPTVTSTLGYARKPIAIASKVYANREGNGDEKSGDGWRYRGAGAIQLTFYNNQYACALHFNVLLTAIGDWLRTPRGACRSAAWFWTTNKVSRYSLVGDFDGVCDLVNRGRKTEAYGDAIGWKDRLELYENAKRVLC